MIDLLGSFGTEGHVSLRRGSSYALDLLDQALALTEQGLSAV